MGRLLARSRDLGALGDPDDFSAFYRRHSVAVVRFFAGRVFDTQVALDLMAETFAQAFLARRTVRGSTEEELGGWLYAIARGQLDRYYRKGRAERRALDRLGLEVPQPGAAELERIEEAVGAEAQRESLRAALGELSDDQRTAIQMRIVDELGYDEVAVRLGVSEQTVRARVSRGLRSLAKALDATRAAEEVAK